MDRASKYLVLLWDRFFVKVQKAGHFLENYRFLELLASAFDETNLSEIPLNGCKIIWYDISDDACQYGINEISPNNLNHRFWNFRWVVMVPQKADFLEKPVILTGFLDLDKKSVS